MAYAAPAVPVAATGVAPGAARAASFTEAAMAAPSGPWWRHPMMWLVVGGPSLVVVASFITLTLAVRHADPVVEHGNQAGSARVSAEEAGTEEGARAIAAAREGLAGGTDGAAQPDPALQPAMRARNHAATGGKEH